LKLNHAILSFSAAFLFVISLTDLSASVTAQTGSDLSAFAGRWQINVSKSTFNRYGPNGKNTPRGAKYTFILTAQDQGLKLDVYNEYPQAAANRSMTILADEKPHACSGDCVSVGGTAPDPNPQTYTYYKIDSHMLVRVTYAKGYVNEYLAYSVSSDGKTLTQVNWSPETPEWQNIYVFEKQP